MPYYKCINKKCKEQDIPMFVSKVVIRYDKDMNKVDDVKECTICNQKRVLVETPMPENISLTGLMKYK